MKIVDDLCKTKDGRWSLTKIAALVAHTMMSFAFAKITLSSGFVPDMWWIYSAAALGHAFLDKSSAQIAAFKEKVLAATTSTKERTDVLDPASEDRPV